jgi:polyphosphate kinase 2
MVEPKFYSAFENVSDKKYRKEKFRYQIELLKMQEWALANNKRIAIVFEGRDAAGKGSAIKRMAENLMTKHHRVIEVGSPTPKQNRSWFHTFEKTLPKKGEIVFYDRSWYSRAMIQPTMKYCSEAQYKYFMSNVNKWEANMISSGITLIKLYLSIDQNTQKKRFEIRKNHSLKYWKLSKNDIESLKMWDQYTYYKNEMFRKTSTKKAPWIIINAKNKMTARLNAFRYVIDYIDYEGKSTIKTKPWNIDMNENRIKLFQVSFENLSKEQYDLLNHIKQMF